jgi:AraC-like DNA-binding protein
MAIQSRDIAVGRLERSCTSCIRMGAAGFGIERAEAFFAGQAFAPHRHDRYAIGVTVSGVQTFRYRGEMRRCLPGELHILHPDEVHDGAPGTDAGFGYRIVYVDPAAIGACLGNRSLPFVRDPVVRRSAAVMALVAVIDDVEEPADEADAGELVATVADTLATLEGSGVPATRIDRGAIARARDCLEASRGAASLSTLEEASGLDRWTLIRQFRAVLGTTPGRYRSMRRLERARDAIKGGASLADAALGAGFADQSHMSRHFKRTYGLTPARWAAAVRAGDQAALSMARRLSR